MTETENNMAQLDETLDMLSELSAYPLLIDKFVPNAIFQDFHLNLKIYLKKCD